MLLCALREWDRRLDFICAKKGKTDGAAVEKPKGPVEVTPLGREDVENYLEAVLNARKSNSNTLKSIKIESTGAGKKFTVAYEYAQKTKGRFFCRTPTFTVDVPVAESGCVVMCKESFEVDRRLDIPETFTVKECKAALRTFAYEYYRTHR